MLDRTTPAPPVRWRPRSDLLRFRSVVLLVLLDCAAIATAFVLAAILYPVARLAFWVPFLGLLLPLYLVLAANAQAFASSNLQRPAHAARRSVGALVTALTLLVVIAFYLKTSGTLSRLTLALGSALAVVLLAGSRYLFVRNLERIVGGNPFNMVLIRDPDSAIPAGRFSLILVAGAELDPDRHDPHMYDRLATALAGVDRVVVSCTPERRLSWARALRGANVQGELLMPELAPLGALAMASCDTQPTIVVAIGPLNLLDRAIKRGFDVAVAGTAVLLFAPLLAAVAAWVKLDSAGPVLFSQTRIGRGNRMFRVLKFRSMREADHGGHRSASRDDDRITRCGRVIRRTSIDELPQLFNVLRGDMSIVGPRPHALGSRAADKLFWEVDHRYWDRHAAKPGLTGLAQVRGFRGATHGEDDLRNRLQSDLEYLESWSIWRDVKIALLTARVLFHRNAF